MLAIFSSNGEAQHLDRRPTVPIGFTIIPAPSEHASYRSYRAAIVDPRAPSPSLQLIRVNDTSFTKDQGTEFVSWIEGGKRALILRVDFPDGICMTDQNDSTCGGDPIHDDFRIAHMRLDVCVVKGSSLVGCPSVKFRKDRNIPTNVYFGPYFYNWAPQAFYDYRGELSEFVFQTHAVSPAYVPKPGEQSDVEMWRMDIDGSRSAKIVEANANAHGCQISPNQQLMVCERRRQGGIGDTDFVLTRSDGSERRFLGADEREPSLLMRWSPDSRFLVYFTEKGGKQRLVYQNVEDFDRLGDSVNHKILDNGSEPAYYCIHQDGLCGLLGDPDDVGSDYPAFSPLLLGQQHPKFLALAVKKPLGTPLKNQRGIQKFKRVLHVIPMDGGATKEIQCRGAIGYPTFSPGGDAIAFLSTPSWDEPRTQLFVVQWKTWKTECDCKQLTFVKKGRQIYNPRWELYSWSHN